MADVTDTDPRGSASSAPPATGHEVFARALVTSAGRQTLDSLDTNAVAREALAAFKALTVKPPGKHHISWRQTNLRLAADGSTTAVLQILNDDTPFLLASVLGEVRAHGLFVRLVLHPIFKTARRPDGTLQAVTAPGDEAWNDGHQESFIALYVDAPDDRLRNTLTKALAKTLEQVRIAVADWRAMLDRVQRAITELSAAPKNVPRDLLAESIAFLEWLRDGQFTFLGVRDYRLEGPSETGELVAVAGLGMLRDPAMQVLRRGSELVAMTPEVRRFFEESQPLIITKSNVISPVHRRVHMDYVGVKLYGADGRPSGELRIVGLLTSSAYTQSPRAIPILRHKVDRVVALSGAPPESHDGKALLNVLETFPRDELFQITVPDLADWAAGILDLDLRPRVRVFARPDPFDRFVSLLVFVPRDRFSTTVRERIQISLASSCAGYISAFNPHFTDGPLVRVHFIIGRRSGPTPRIDTTALERDIAAITRTWEDTLAARLGTRASGGALLDRYGRAFPAAYTETFSPDRALEDIARLERLGPDRPVSVDFYADPSEPTGTVRVAIYRIDDPIRLSERVPVLENLGFSVIDERTYRLRLEMVDAPREVVLHDMILETIDGHPLDIEAHGNRLEDGYLAVKNGQTESDGFNRLIVAAGIDWRQAAIIRAYAAFLRQLGTTFGLRYLADTVVKHAALARELIALFNARFDPALGPAAGETMAGEITARIEGALTGVLSLDEDRILRQLLTLVGATVRTNVFMRDAAGLPPPTIAFKFDGRKLEMAPLPRTFREIWVWSPRVEGVHLRFAPIARGGIRWSDRAQDFRTEVLGLAKAQQVKNAVIVPAGAKGGFIPKHLSRAGTRDEIQKEGITAYTIFVEAMLSITDNLRDGAIVPPPRVVRHDGDDPYLVVAADKGTATFSDTANGISLAHDFWLGDAFASGGSAGYDHKRLAITSRGAWECVKRHFREIDIDIQTQPIRVVGVGDMSGDVFGNGVLRSRHLRLVAAFDHRDIFIDPNPDPEATWIERKRLFDLPRSSWADFDRAKLSKGGDVWSRSLKSIELSDEARALLGIEAKIVTPAELARAILACESDLLYFGGIGTFIRAAAENDAAVGDRSNDAIRITSAEVRAKVIGEGANLGMTQRARVECALRGVRLNTDFIDNSAGVNTSDQEVNIKIALRPAMQNGKLALADRNTLLATMSDDVARAVLRNNTQQSLALSLAERTALADIGANKSLIRALRTRGMLDPRLEFLPTDAEMAERQRTGRGYVRPELAVLSSYAKIALLHDLLASAVPDDPYMRFMLVDYFSPALQTAYRAEIEAHRLGREIIATTLTNGLINRLGPAIPLLLAEEAARPITETAYAFMAARSVFGLSELWARIDALDGVVAGEVQLDIYARVQSVLRSAVAYFLRSGATARDLTGVISHHKGALGELITALPTVAPEGARRRMADIETRLTGANVPAELAVQIARLELIVDAPAIAEAARDAKRPVSVAAAVWLGLGERFAIDRLVTAARALHVQDDYDRLAIAGAEAAIADARARITRVVLSSGSGALSGLDAYLVANRVRVERAERDLAAVAEGEMSVSRLAVAAARLTDLARDTAAARSSD